MSRPGKSLLPPRKRLQEIGPWDLGRTIGKGSAGKVKIARHKKINKLAAVKIISKRSPLNKDLSYVGDSETKQASFQRAVQREIVIMKLLDHPNVLKLYDLWENRNQLYMIMEYIEGGELFDYIVEHSPLPLSEVVDYFQQIVFAISHFHSRTIAHRDLKPENILIDSNYNIKVADFGMATWDSHPDLLKTSCGSPHYASPEIINGDRYEGKLSDVWSCGIILHALLVGSLPFNHKDVPILLQKIKKAEFEMPEDICDEAKDLLRRMLEKDPRQRIVIAEIIQHPFFMMFPPRLDKRFRESEFTAPPSPIVELDPEIFGNLRDLRPDLSERQLLKALVFEGSTWEKAVYHTLQKYRTKRYMENSKTDISSDDAVSVSAKPHIARPSHPTPSKAKGHRREPASWLARRHSQPGLSKSISEWSSFEGSMHLYHVSSTMHDESAVHLPPRLVGSFKTSSSPDLRVISNELIPKSFEDALERLNAGEASVDPAEFDYSIAMSLKSPLLGDSKIAFDSAIFGDMANHTSTPNKRSNTRVPTIQQTPHQTDKENINPKHVSLRPSRTPLGKRVQDVHLSRQHDGALNSYTAGINSPSQRYPWTGSAFSQTLSTSPIPSRIGRFTNWLNIKQTPGELLSSHGLEPSIIQCKGLLVNLGLSVTTSQKERSATLKCSLIPKDDHHHLLTARKALQFRIEFKPGTKAHMAAGYTIVMAVILEKGAASSFKAVYARLREDWYADMMNSPPAARRPVSTR